MKALIFGGSGQVGWELQRSLAALGDVTSLNRRGTEDLTGDFLDPVGVRQSIRAVRPDVVVNAAAFTAVDQAEKERNVAWQINAETPGQIAEEVKALGALMVHYSSDYVFDGGGEKPWVETDPASPVNEYGHSKLAGDKAIRETGCRHAIFRTSWVYACRRDNFVASILRLAADRDELRVVDDQVGAPTGAELIADTTALALDRLLRDGGESGTYHLAARGETNWCDYAKFIVRAAQSIGGELKLSAAAIHGIPSSEYPLPARRPSNSRLDCSLLESTFGLAMPDWRAGVARAVAELTQADR